MLKENDYLDKSVAEFILNRKNIKEFIVEELVPYIRHLLE